MKRQDRIYEYVIENTQNVSDTELKEQAALTTSLIAENLNIARSNVSKELNELVRKNKLSKISGRPVRYCRPLTEEGQLPQQSSQDPSSYHIEDGISGMDLGKKKLAGTLEEPTRPVTLNKNTNIFDRMIGKSRSMHNQIEQAKAAMLYPPRGLNTLIIGPTGSGKTYFANAMFEFAQTKGLIDRQQQLVTFNCADYAHNPELLMSHLFGYIQGAFTGANDEQDGLIQEADGGMLFLDEVHRLPPEGQEMIFYFMDHGTYNRLGETSKNHHADVRLVCATTEDPESSLLQTFVRRIPITIQLPAFNKRSPEERIDLLRSLVTIEANRTNKEITLTEDVVQALLGSVTYGNVGQLKSNIQLVCAKGFLNNIENEGEIMITADDLPSNIKDGLLNLASNRAELGAISKLLEPYMVIKPGSSYATPVSRKDSYELPYNLYEIIGDKAMMLREEGLDQENINNFITTDINLHLKSFYKNESDTRQAESKLAEIVDKGIIDFAKQVQPKIENQLDYHFKENFIYAMSLHISSFIKRIQSGKPMRLMGNDLVAMVKDYPEELAVAKSIKEMLEQRYGMPIPESESYYLAVLLISLRTVPTSNGQVGIVVAAHGSSTASSMTQVVSQLLSDNSIQAFDMPLDMNPQTAYKGIVERVRAANQGEGVLLLVDMGSLSTFGSKITEETQIPVKVIDMVTTAMVLEATRKASFIDSDLNDIYAELREFHGYSRVAIADESNVEERAEDLSMISGKPKAIVAVCSTGEGTAKKIKDLLDQLLVQNLIEDIKVFPISIVNMQDHIQQINTKYTIVAATGVMNPQIGVPFMPLQTLLQGGGEKFVRQLAERSEVSWVLDEQDSKLTRSVCRQYLSQYFVFLNADKFTDILWNYVDYLAETKKVEFSESFCINLIMHIAGAVERMLTNNPMETAPEELAAVQDEVWFKLIQKADDKYLRRIQIEMTPSEEFYVYKLLETWQEKNDTILSEVD
ncbi:sigma-54-dependent transcriptional regulator [Pediococcus pentosaceus]|uniref:sigma-54-dependent transcriptional regulator n=1 Tax=Pediococcus pentosaceus TaxID=1255 RepID=UPI0022E29163|nr:sigma 54-interacting transcriptional regulator [Pediococcus pentosaceus]